MHQTHIFLPSDAVDPIDFLESLKDDEEPRPGPASSTEYPNGVNVIPGTPYIIQHYAPLSAREQNFNI